MRPVKVYLGVPQTEKLPVYVVKQEQQLTIRQMLFTNTSATDAKITITVNTIDIMKDLVISAGETRVIDTSIVLDPSDTLFLRQEKENAINVTISGTLEQSYQ